MLSVRSPHIGRQKCPSARRPLNARLLAALILTVAGITLSIRPATAREQPDTEATDQPLTVAAVQFEISEVAVADLERFEHEVYDAIMRAADRGSDLVVFPEYQNVFAALSEHDAFLTALSQLDLSGEQIEDSIDGTAADSTRSAAAQLFHTLQTYTGYESVHELFASSSEESSQWIDRIYGRAAAEYEVTVVAGTYFALDGAQEGDSRLTNRAVVYGPDGERIYEQDKVFLTAFERGIVELSSGEADDAEGFEVEGWSVGLTICRDTYFPVWDEIHAERDLWIDLRGEGTEYDESVRERLQDAVPARLLESDVRYGMTVFLTGEFHGLFWEGRSSTIEASDDTVEALSEVESATQHELLVVELDPP